MVVLRIPELRRHSGSDRPLGATLEFVHLPVAVTEVRVLPVVGRKRRGGAAASCAPDAAATHLALYQLALASREAHGVEVVVGESLDALIALVGGGVCPHAPAVLRPHGDRAHPFVREPRGAAGGEVVRRDEREGTVERLLHLLLALHALILPVPQDDGGHIRAGLWSGGHLTGVARTRRHAARRRRVERCTAGRRARWTWLTETEVEEAILVAPLRRAIGAHHQCGRDACGFRVDLGRGRIGDRRMAPREDRRLLVRDGIRDDADGGECVTAVAPGDAVVAGLRDVEGTRHAG